MYTSYFKFIVLGLNIFKAVLIPFSPFPITKKQNESNKKKKMKQHSLWDGKKVHGCGWLIEVAP